MLRQQRGKVGGCVAPLHKHLAEIAKVDVVIEHTVGANITKKPPMLRKFHLFVPRSLQYPPKLTAGYPFIHTDAHFLPIIKNINDVF
jgi:hypothetical protein